MDTLVSFDDLLADMTPEERASLDRADEESASPTWARTTTLDQKAGLGS